VVSLAFLSCGPHSSSFLQVFVYATLFALIGMMLVGRHFEEATLIRLASAIEAGDDWTRH